MLNHCAHEQTFHTNISHFCTRCGIYLTNPNIKCYKSLAKQYHVHFNPTEIISSLSKVSLKKQPDQNYITTIRANLIDFMNQVAKNLRLSLNTFFLAMVYLDNYALTHQLDQPPLYGITALMLAAKSTEKDEFIPFISNLKMFVKHAPSNAFKSAELQLIKAMKWELHQVSLVDRVEFLLSFGVVDDEDTHDKKVKNLGEENVHEIVESMEEQYREVCLNVLKNDKLFFSNDDKMLSLAIIGYLRKRAGFLNHWSQHLAKMSGVEASELSGTLSKMMILLKRTSKQLHTNTNLQNLPLQEVNKAKSSFCKQATVGNLEPHKENKLIQLSK